MTLKDIINRIDIWDEWLNSYKNFVPKFISEAKSGKDWSEWDKKIFYEFFERSADQCVSSLKQGYFTNEEKSKLKQNWKELSPLFKELANNQTEPNWECYNKIKTAIRKHTSQDRRASTNRIIASLQPQLLCTIVSERHLYELFTNLKKNISDDIPEYIGGDWFRNSNNILNLFKQEFPDEDYMNIITYPWQVREFFKADNEKQQKMHNTVEETKKILETKKQIILQGAPGTGKTYKTAELAVALCDGEDNIPAERKELMNRYRELSRDGRIAFTTFHQSMDYEEFVEGLKPVSTSNGVTFEAKAGLFKEICDRALLKTISLSKNISTELEYDDIYDSLIELIQSGEIKELPTKTGQKIIDLKITAQNNIQFNGQEGGSRSYMVSKERLRKLFLHFDTITAVDGIKNINDEVRNVIGGCHSSAYWAVLKYIVDNKNGVDEETVDLDNLSNKDKESAVQVFINTPAEKRASNQDTQNYVLIIDEINRGNISKILGELITLLEADKRIGEQNELTAKLPYSQKEFGVPSNLYIIGTMNTADRSVGYIDYAIRRRFGFVTIKSDFNAIADQLGDVVKPIADMLYKSVEKLMEQVSPEFNAEDLMIGHSYFIAKDVPELEMKLEYEIKPLLREYANDGILNLQKDSKTKKYTSIEELSINNQQPSDAK